MKRIVFLGVVFLIVLLAVCFCLMSCEASGTSVGTSVSREQGIYLAQVFFDEVEKVNGFFPEFVEIFDIKVEIREFKGYGLRTQTLVAIAYVRWQDGEKKETFYVSETLRLATGGDSVSRAPLTLEEHVKIVKRIAQQFGDL